MAVHNRELALRDDEEMFLEDWIVSDAASVVYASIGREILSGTIRAFHESLLSLQSHPSAVENIWHAF